MIHNKSLSERSVILFLALLGAVVIESSLLIHTFVNPGNVLTDVWYIILPMLLIILFYLLSFGYYFIVIPKEMPIAMQHINELLDRQSAIKMSKKQAEFLALQNQISPHFLYNTLEAIRGDALDVGMYKIAETTEALATFFRYTITEVENLVTLEDELANVENYFIIQQYRFGEKLHMKIETGENIGVLQTQLPKLTLQPIIENAVFHGLECKRGEGTIRIHIETTKTKLLISIIDDGVGIEEEQLDMINRRLDHIEMNYEIGDKETKHGGIALFNVSSRIKLLFGEEYGLHIYSNKNIGTNVRITLPLTTEEKR